MKGKCGRIEILHPLAVNMKLKKMCERREPLDHDALSTVVLIQKWRYNCYARLAIHSVSPTCTSFRARSPDELPSIGTANSVDVRAISGNAKRTPTSSHKKMLQV